MTIVPVPSSDAAISDRIGCRAVQNIFRRSVLSSVSSSAVVLLLAGRIWGPDVAALLAVATSIAVTGALHEDGLADTADGFGGGCDRAKSGSRS